MSFEQILSTTFPLTDLKEELDWLRDNVKGGKTGLHRAIAGMVRQALIDHGGPWPGDKMGRLFAVAYLLENPAPLDVSVRFRHQHEKRQQPGEKFKSSGLKFRRGGL